MAISLVRVLAIHVRSSVCTATRICIYIQCTWQMAVGYRIFLLGGGGGKFSHASMKPVNDVHVYVNERCRMKRERSKQGQTNNRAKQHSTPQCTYIHVYMYDGL